MGALGDDSRDYATTATVWRAQWVLICSIRLPEYLSRVVPRTEAHLPPIPCSNGCLVVQCHLPRRLVVPRITDLASSFLAKERSKADV